VTTRARGRRDLDDLDDVDVLETYGWSEDPWDGSLGVGEVEQVRSQTRSAKWVGYAALALANVLIIVGGVYGWWYIRQANAPGDIGGPIEFTIAEGENLNDISTRLEEQGIVENSSFFRSYVADHGGLEVTPGYYRLPTGDSVGNVLARLRTPPEETFIEITFPEGFTLRQIGARLAQQLPQLSAEAFMAAATDATVPARFRPSGVTSLEGLLFPATYRVYNADSERQVVIRMVEQMERVAEGQEEITAGPTGVPFDYTPYEVLTIASIIEREAKTEKDRALIARVIYNRLANNLPLEIDATAIYGAPPELLPPAVEELDIDTIIATPNPWNTYDFVGLPPTPIANPGRASIEAALHPAPNPSPGSRDCAGVPANQCMWLFYVLADEQGNHAFAVTGDQHQANVQAAVDAGLL
jgi:peptidoglycan lytic transglycosylase G